MNSLLVLGEIQYQQYEKQSKNQVKKKDSG